MSFNKDFKERQKIMTKALRFAVSKDETRRQLMGACHASSMRALCATDGYCAAVLGSRYSVHLADKIIDVDTLEHIDREYPKMNAVLPTFRVGEWFTVHIEKHHVRKAAKNKKPTAAHFHRVGDSEGLRIDFDKSEGAIFSLNSALLAPLATTNGRTFDVHYMKELSPVSFALDHEHYRTNNIFRDYYLIMPIKA